MVRVRFAPSPTGDLHIGNAWTALLNLAFVKKKGGTFLLRIEDTDKERSSKEYEISILSDLSWLGIEFDGQPVRQSERLPIYLSLALSLIRKGLAYKCFCPKEGLEREREDALRTGRVHRYNGRCRDLSSFEVRRMERRKRPYAVRLKALPVGIEVRDVIKGTVVFPEGHVDDFVLIKEDRTPTFNFACAVDDMLMGITHVIRGQDHLSNTPKQIMVFTAFGQAPPEYAHHPLLLGADGKPLSKRHGVTSIRELREMGFLREAIVDYLLSLGKGEEKKSWSETESGVVCPLSHLSGADFRFDMERLLRINAAYLRRLSGQAIASKLGLPKEEEGMIEAVKENARTLKDVTSLLRIFHTYEIEPDALSYLISRPEAKSILSLLHAHLERQGRPEGILEELSEMAGRRKRDFLLMLRAITTGRLTGPPLQKILPLLDAGIVKQRLACLKRSL